MPASAALSAIVSTIVRRLAGFRVAHLHPRVQDLQRRGDPPGCVEDVERGHCRALQRLVQDERQLDLDPRPDKPAERHDPAVGEDHVIEDHAVVGFGDGNRLLHGPRGEADLARPDGPALGDLGRDQRPLHAVGVLDRHVRVLQGQLADRLARAFGREQPPGRVGDRMVVEHAQYLRVRSRTEGYARRRSGHAVNRAPVRVSTTRWSGHRPFRAASRRRSVDSCRPGTWPR